jgi:hypothetical protein
VLSHQEREDLLANLAEEAQRPAPLPPLTPIIESSINVTNAQLSTQIRNDLPVDKLSKNIPKYIRELSFFTQVKLTEPQTLYHRWRFNNQYITTVSFHVEQTQHAIWSTQKMSSAWQGRWDIELLNAKHDVIYRQTFIYGRQK